MPIPTLGPPPVEPAARGEHAAGPGRDLWFEARLALAMALGVAIGVTIAWADGATVGGLILGLAAGVLLAMVGLPFVVEATRRRPIGAFAAWFGVPTIGAGLLAGQVGGPFDAAAAVVAATIVASATFDR